MKRHQRPLQSAQPVNRRCWNVSTRRLANVAAHVDDLGLVDAAAEERQLQGTVQTLDVREWSAVATDADRRALGRCIQIAQMAFHKNPAKTGPATEPEPLPTGAAVTSKNGRVERGSGRIPQYRWDPTADVLISGPTLAQAVNKTFANWRSGAVSDPRRA
eukprot:SAG31_NODE_13742_length_850_cov_0.884154_1_plen_159_part_10